MIMKKILLIFLLFPFIVTAQTHKDSLKWAKDTLPLPHLPVDTSGIITYKIIETVPGVSKNELYLRAKLWTAMAFKSAQNVIQLDDKEGGSLVIKALSVQYFEYKLFGLANPIRYYLHYMARFTIKEGKYRMIISDFTVETIASQYAASVSYPVDSDYKSLNEWNQNAKTGNMEFNRQSDLGGKSAVRIKFGIINDIDNVSKGLLADAKKTLSQPAKADDF